MHKRLTFFVVRSVKVKRKRILSLKYFPFIVVLKQDNHLAFSVIT